METTTDSKSRFAAIAFTVGFHGLLLLACILIVFITPIPPFKIVPPIELEIGLGMEGLGSTDAGGSGPNDPDIATTPAAASNEVSNNETPNTVVDDTETESVNVKTNPNSKSDAKADTEPKPSSELLNALAALKNKNKHTGKGEGDGNTGGSGTGTQKGVGGGDGTGHGNNTPGYNGKGGYDLKGRMLVQKPERMTDSEEEGIVVVEIIVAADGRVTKAIPGKRGSTTTSSKLFAKARQAALQARFNASPDGTSEQHGTYTFVFTLE
jgi:TonB family protein